MKLKVLPFGVACGLIWGVGLFLITWWIIAWDGTTYETTLIGQVYRGYELSPKGSVFGLIWGLVDGFVGGLIFAWIYNFLAGKCTCKED